MSKDPVTKTGAAGHSRRTFMKVAASAAASATAVGRAAGEGDGPVRLGVVGTGSRGCDLIRHLAELEGARIVAVCDDYVPHLAAGRRYGGEHAAPFGDYDGMLDGSALDGVVIATPLHLHYPMCVRAVERGLAVFCEKTMCYSVDEARRLTELVAARNGIFQVGLQRRSNAIYEQAEAMVRTGMLGTVTAIVCQWHRNDDWRREVPVGAGEPEYDALERRLNWRLYGATSQGLMAELGSHQLDVANRLLGCPPSEVTAVGGIDYYRDGRDVNDTVYCTYTYHAPDGGEGKPQIVRVTFSSVQTNAYAGVSEVVMGTKGTLYLSQKKALFYREGTAASGQPDVDGLSGATLRVSNNPWAHRGQPVEIDSDADDTAAELASFVRDVRAGNRATACTARVGLENAATALMANEAMGEGKTVSFPEGCSA